ncbi:Pro-Hyp dipeptidase. Metallo peptidase. MEROPS family M38 [Sphingomonas laterariae]|uniref:Pro-Hyp dipeptidase. Metallo peptidase. MEROPS family M38 n=1 Tax=Edaphosphingomonas laterariae TaxID=861865 RepID=A0A239FUM0_9SPHN|nr:amidohydrolase family protein [Sphingomonas laterariae]SNS59614.1 Pro-Hyp dipeptidase. Metallo peptidase. MEROPS family M38 [Sphingomonas laterariae]
MRNGLGALAALLLSTVCAMPAAAETVVVTAARMFDAKAGRIVDEPVVVITDGRIQSVVTRGAARPVIPADARRVDLGDMTILPGLIDMHVHLDSNPIYGGYTGLQFTDSFWAMQGTANAKAMLEAGFTTVRNVGSSNYNDVGMKQAIDEGLIAGPRIVPAAHALGATGGHCDETYLPPSFHAKGEAVGDSIDELRQRVREQRKYGAEVIKVCATGGVFSRNTEPGQQQLTEAELKGIADEAHMWGLKVAAHAHGAAGIKAAIRAGIDTIEHASLIDDEGIKLARDHGAYLSMDIFNTEYTQAEGARNGVMEDNLRKDREVADIQRNNFRKAHAAGVKLVFGTDAGVMPHATAGGQFAIMVRYGMTPAEAIQAATVNAAAALGRDATVGSIAAGRYGDIIAVAGDPTRDVRLLETIPFVMKGGDVVKAAN